MIAYHTWILYKRNFLLYHDISVKHLLSVLSLPCHGKFRMFEIGSCDKNGFSTSSEFKYFRHTYIIFHIQAVAHTWQNDDSYTFSNIRAHLSKC